MSFHSSSSREQRCQIINIVDKIKKQEYPCSHSHRLQEIPVRGRHVAVMKDGGLVKKADPQKPRKKKSSGKHGCRVAINNYYTTGTDNASGEEILRLKMSPDINRKAASSAYTPQNIKALQRQERSGARPAFQVG